ncbi:MAG: UbiD family decarboxylase [bacterium]
MTSPRDLREWMERLEGAGRLLRVGKRVRLRHELAAVSQRLDGEKAVRFEATDGPPMPLVANVCCRREWFADALGVPAGDLLPELQRRQEVRLPPREVGDAPFLKNVRTEDIDVGKILPLPTYHEHDGGPYVSAGVFFAHDPETGEGNVSIHRMQLLEPDLFGLLVLPRHLKGMLRRAHERGEALRVAVAVGLDPLLLMASQLVLGPGEDELEAAGGLRGEAVEVARAPWSGIPVPAGAEIVIEGEIPPGELRREGPFGEFPRYYSPAGEREVLRVRSVAWREGAALYSIVPAGRDHLLMGALPREAGLLRDLQRAVPSVRDVSLPLSASGRFHCVIQLDKRNEGEAKSALLAALAAHYDVKHAIAVDRDIDPHDAERVDWALATRFQADRDLIVAPGAWGSRLDPSAAEGVTAKMGLDATVPPGALEDQYLPLRIPGAEEIDLEALLGE